MRLAGHAAAAAAANAADATAADTDTTLSFLLPASCFLLPPALQMKGGPHTLACFHKSFLSST